MKIRNSTCIIAFSLQHFSADSRDSSETELPEKVQNSFRSMYQDAHLKEWEWKKKEMIYEIEFIKDGEKYETYFSSEGKWLRTEREIKKSDLPKAVIEGFEQSDFSDWKIDEVEEHLLPEDKLVYEIEVEHGEQEYDLYFEPDGTLLGKMSKR